MLIANISKSTPGSKAFNQWVLNIEAWLGDEFHSVKKQSDGFLSTLFKFKHQSLSEHFVGQGHAVLDNGYFNLESPTKGQDQNFIEQLTTGATVPQGSYIAFNDRGDRVDVISYGYDSPPLYLVKFEESIFFTTDSRTLLFLDGFSLEPELEKVRKWLLATKNSNNDTEKFSGTCLKGVELIPFNCQFHIDKNKSVEHAVSSYEKNQSKSDNTSIELGDLSLEESVKHFEDTLQQVVRTSTGVNENHLLELSAEVSSAAVASAFFQAEKNKSDKSNKTHATSMYFSHPSLVNTNDLNLAKESAKNINTPLTALDCTPMLRVHGLNKDDAWSRIDSPSVSNKPFWQELTQQLAYKTQTQSIWSGEGAFVASGSLYCFDDVIKQDGWQKAIDILTSFDVPKLRARYLVTLSYLTSKIPSIGATLVYLLDLETKNKASYFSRALFQSKEWAKEPTLARMHRHYHLNKYGFTAPSVKAGLIPVKSPLLDQRMINFCDGIKQSYLYDMANDKNYPLSETYVREKQIMRKSFLQTIPEAIATKQYETSYRELMVHTIKNSANSIVDDVLAGKSLLNEYNLIEPHEFKELACHELANVAMDFYPASDRTLHFNKQLSVESWLRFLSMSDEEKQTRCHPLYKSNGVEEVLNNA